MKAVTSILVFLMFFIHESHQYIYTCNTTAPCGCSSAAASVTRIVGGEYADFRSWGWAVSISVGGGLCGGSVISNRWILTAAHCVDGILASAVTVYAGSNFLGSGQSRSVSNIYMHPRYDSTTIANDIALLRLSTVLNMTDPNVKPICVPNVSSSVLNTTEWPAPGLYATSVGWGTTSEGGDISSLLQQVTVRVITNSNAGCATSVSVANRPYMFCAGFPEGGKDTCQGDSGGPLMIYTTSRQWVQVGIVSFGQGCARPNLPGVYTRLAYYTTWIRSVTNTTFLNPTSSNFANINPIESTTTSTTRSSTRVPTSTPRSSTPDTTIPIISSCESIFHRISDTFALITMVFISVFFHIQV